MIVPDIVIKGYCPRCSHPIEDVDVTCGFCQWPFDDPGIECICGYLNKVIASECECCERTL